MKKVLVCLPVNNKQKEYLESKGKDCVFIYKAKEEVTIESVQDIQIIMGNVSPEIVKQAPKLEWLQLNSAGYEKYKGLDCVVTSANGAYGLAVSEHMLALTLALIRHFDIYMKHQNNHIWKDAGNIISIEGSTVLILGMGDIGSQYAKKIKALGAHTIGFRKHNYEKPECFDQQHLLSELDTYLPQADIVAMVLPSSQETYHVMNEKRIQSMKSGAYLINVGRGDAIDTEALKNASHLGGIGLDVFEQEPLPEDSFLWDLEHVIITPHVAGNFYLDKTVDNIVKLAGENLEAWLNHKALKNQI